MLPVLGCCISEIPKVISLIIEFPVTSKSKTSCVVYAIKVCNVNYGVKWFEHVKYLG